MDSLGGEKENVGDSGQPSPNSKVYEKNNPKTKTTVTSKATRIETVGERRKRLEDFIRAKKLAKRYVYIFTRINIKKQ